MKLDFFIAEDDAFKEEKKEYIKFLENITSNDFLLYIDFKHYNILLNGDKADIQWGFDQYNQIFLAFIQQKPYSFFEGAVELMQEKIKNHTHFPWPENDPYTVLTNMILFKKIDEQNQKAHQVVRHKKI